ncbi:hypothetical protein [Amorphus sp. 3PC139-8]|uniref:hypothetical protein n=1 Tax=Amorphus sp. 3PC139-8 TaxID=2735676 RepID=UPI00345C6F82
MGTAANLVLFVGPSQIFGSAGVLIGATVSRVAAAVWVLWLLNRLLVLDGWDPLPSDQSRWERFGSFLLATGVFGLCLGAMVTIAISMGGISPESVDAGMNDPDSLMALRLFGRALADVGCVAAGGAFFWPVLLVSQQIGSRQAWRRSMGTILALPRVLIIVAFMGYGTLILTVQLPLGLNIVAMPVWLAWLYVGAREIFAGIDQNGTRRELRVAGTAIRSA